MVALEHFYYGQLVHYGKAVGEQRVLAKSAQITDEHIAAGVRFGLLTPVPNAPLTSWGIVRGGRSAPFLMVQASKGDAGQLLRHIILLPSDALRDLQGFIKALTPLLETTPRVFEMLADTLAPLQMPEPDARGVDEQADDLLNLMTYTRNNTRNIEPLLAAIIQGTNVVVQNAPYAPDVRNTFIQALLNMLPSSTRFGVTFAMNRQAGDGISAQIAFMSDPPDVPAVIYNWQNGEISGESVSDDYSHYIVSQLRLDASMAIRQGEELTRIAGWRFKNGDRLADALAYASYRQKIDKALINGMPVEISDVSRVLADDPTLTDALRLIYAQHVLNFSLALDDMQYADPVAVILHKFPNLAELTLKQMHAAINKGKGAMIFQTLVRWMANPLAPQGPEWIELMHKAALAELKELAEEQDTNGMIAFLDNVRSIDSSMMMGKIAPEIIETAVPLVERNIALSTRLLLLAMEHLDDEAFRLFLLNPRIERFLSAPIRRLLTSLQQPRGTQRGVVVAAAESLAEPDRPLALRRFSQLVYEEQRLDLFDAPTLEELSELARTPQGQKHAAMLTGLMLALNTAWLEQIEPPGPFYILKTLMNLGRYDVLARALVDQSRSYYGSERQLEFIRMVQRLFAQASFTPESAQQALDQLDSNGLSGLSHVAAGCGALQGAKYPADLKLLANHLTRQITNDPNYQESIPPEALLALLVYYQRNTSLGGMTSAAWLLADNAAQQEPKAGLTALNNGFKVLWEQAGQRGLAFEMLRRYIRVADETPVQRAIAFFGKEIGGNATRQLETTQQFSYFIGKMNVRTYAVALNNTANVLQRHVEMYLDKNNRPQSAQIVSAREQLRTKLSHEDRILLGQELKRLAHAILLLGHSFQRNSSRNMNQIDALLKGTQDPRSVVDVFRVAGGHLAQGRYYRLTLHARPESDPLADLEPRPFLESISQAAHILSSVLNPLPPDQPVSWTARDIIGEVDSLIYEIPRDEAKNMLRQLAANWQRLAELVVLIFDNSDSSALAENSKIGKQLDEQRRLPASPLELYRFLYSILLAQR